MPSFRDFKAVKHELAELAGRLAKEAEVLELTEVAENLGEWQSKIIENRFRVLFLGDFKRGKSTAINAFLGDKVLPSDMKPCTGGITCIRYGKPPKAEAHFWEDKPPREMTMEEFKHSVVIPTELLVPESGKEVTDRRQALDKIPYKELVVYAPLDMCRNGVELVDSPGLDEDRRRTELTTSYVPKSDCGIFLLAANQLLSAGERENIESFRNMGLGDMFFVVNFWDLVEDADDPEKEATDLKDRVRKLLPNEKRVYYVSARSALRGKMRDDQAKVDESGFAIFEQEVTDFLTRERASIMMSRYHTVLHRGTSEIVEAVQQRRDLAQQSLEEVQKAYDEARPKLELAQQRQKQIEALFEEHRDTTLTRIEEDFEAFCVSLPTELEEASFEWESQGVTVEQVRQSYIKAGQRFLRMAIEKWSATSLRDICREGVDGASVQADELASEVVRDMFRIRRGAGDTSKMESTTAERLSAALTAECPEAHIAAEDMPVHPTSEPWSHAKANIVETGAAMGGGLVGAKIGSAIAPGVGTLVGWVIGFVAGAGFAGKLKDEDAQRAEAGQQVPHDAIRASVVSAFTKQISGYRKQSLPGLIENVRDVFAGHGKRYAKMLKREIKNTEGQLLQILNAKKEKSLEVEPELRRLDEVKANVDEVAASVNRLMAEYTDEE